MAGNKMKDVLGGKKNIGTNLEEKGNRADKALQQIEEKSQTTSQQKQATSFTITQEAQNFFDMSVLQLKMATGRKGINKSVLVNSMIMMLHEEITNVGADSPLIQRILAGLEK